MARLFIVTGDHSGDIHAANVVKALQAQVPHLEVAAVGGNQLREAGATLVSDQSKMGSMGVGGLVKGLSHHYFLGKKILKFLKDFNPQAVLLIDYGVFNLWLAGQLKKRGYRVFYFIPPQVWASRKGRLKKIKGAVEKVFCIFPFEEAVYQAEDIPVQFVGHPLVGQLPPPENKADFCARHGLDPNRPIIAVFPGSRKMEIQYLLAPILGSVANICQYYLSRGALPPQMVLAQAPSLSAEFFKKEFANAKTMLQGNTIHLVQHQNHQLLSVADAAIVASGTTTLEAALYQTPMVLIYRGHWISYQLFKKLCYLSSIGLPNILTDPKNRLVPELWQYEVTPERISEELMPFLDPVSPQSIRAQQGFQKIHQALGAKNAADCVAEELRHILMDSSIADKYI